MTTTELSHEARELHLFLSNDYVCWKGALCPAAKALAKRYDDGTFDFERAFKAMRHVADVAAKRYTEDHCSPGSSWFRQFTVPVRNEVARELASDLRDDLDNDERWWS